MFPLDRKTVERIASIVVDRGGAERKGWQLEQLFADAGWTNPPEYDGSPRVLWVVEQLAGRNDDRSAIESFLRRICDPIEYDDGMPVAKAVCEAVNEVLRPELLSVSHVRDRPVVGELTAGGGEQSFSQPPDLERRLNGLFRDRNTVEVLVRRATEADMCASADAYTFAIIGIGSFVEGLLLELLLERDERIREHGFVDQNGKRTKAERAGLAQILDTARKKDWIQLDAADFMAKVRDYRNYVHPRKELAQQPGFDHDSVRLCWAPVHAVLNDLERQLSPIGS